MLIFNVRNQNISRIDNFSPAEKSENYLEAQFNFKTDDWQGVTKTAVFENAKTKVIKDVILVNDKCLVPWEVLEGNSFIKVSVYGVSLSEKITTDIAEFKLNNTLHGGSATTEPTPDVYQQIIDMLDDIAQNGVTDEQIKKAVENYLAENPIGGADGSGGEIDESIIKSAVEEYLTENPIEDSLSGKRILCVGDSICEGVGTTGKPYAYWMQQWHPTADVINLGVGGMTIAQRDTSVTNSMPVRIASGEFESSDYANIDIVIFEGGINDFMNNVKLGYITKGYSVLNYKTFCQGMEYMFQYFKDLYPSARMIFMSTHNITAYDYNKAQAWWGAASEICAKWGIEYLDLFGLICTPKITGLQLHPGDEVHRDYYAKYLNMALTSTAPLAAARTTHYYKHNVPIMMQFYNGTRQFMVGSSISTSDWRINMIRADLTTYVNVSSQVTYDYSDVDTSNIGVYPVHVAYVEDGIVLSIDVDVTVADSGSAVKTLDSISATKTKTNFAIGDTVNTDDIVVTATYSDGSAANVTDSATIDTSNANMNSTGEYNIAISYTEGTVTKYAQIQIIVGDSGIATDWDDSAVIEQAWATEAGVFDSIKISGSSTNFVDGEMYDVTCKLIVESDTATKGQVVLRFGGEIIDLGEVTFGEIIEVNGQLKANNGWIVDGTILTCNVYTTTGSNFPWTVYIKDFMVGGVSKTLSSISATKTVTSYNVGDTVATDDIVVIATYSNGSTADVTSLATIDTSNVNNVIDGIYDIYISYTENSIIRTTTIPVTIGSGGNIGYWDDSATITAAWKSTEGMFENVTITEKYTAETTYNVSCKLMVESNTATSGQVVLRVGGTTSDLGTVAFGETIDVNVPMKANANWTIGNLQPNVYTTSGAGFPWTVYIKDFAINPL